MGAVPLCLMGDEMPDTQRDDLSRVGFPHPAGVMALRTTANIGRKPYQWLFRKQGAKREIAMQLLQMLAQTLDEGKSAVFFSRS